MFTRIKNWWKGCTTAQKVNAVLDIIGIGLTGYGIHKFNQAVDRVNTNTNSAISNAFEYTTMIIGIHSDDELAKHIGVDHCTIDTPVHHEEMDMKRLDITDLKDEQKEDAE